MGQTTAGAQVYGTPVYDVQRPLVLLDPNNRGFKASLLPPKGPFSDDPKNDVELFRMSPGASVARAELFGICLGIGVERAALSTYIREGFFVLPSVRAILKWGIGSVSFEAQCDWMHGTQLSISCEDISVSARYVKNSIPFNPGPVPDAALDPFPTFVVSGGVSYGNVGRNSNPARFTELVQLESEGDTVDVIIPPFAISFTVIPFKPSTTFDVEVVALGTGYSALYTFGNPLTNVGQYDVENAFPLYNGAQLLRFTNTGSSGPALAVVIFGLAL